LSFLSIFGIILGVGKEENLKIIGHQHFIHIIAVESHKELNMFGECNNCNELGELNESELCQECAQAAQNQEITARSMEAAAYFEQLVKGVEKSFNTIYQETGDIINICYANNELILEVLDKLNTKSEAQTETEAENKLSIGALWIGLALMSIAGIIFFSANFL